MTGRPRRGRAAIVVLGAVVVGLVVGLGIDIFRHGGLEAWLSSGRFAPIDGPQYEAHGRVIDVDGRGVYLDCRGTGSPTVVLEAGAFAGADSWATLLDGVAAMTRVCAWDRPGIGRSAPRPVHSAALTVDDLRTVLVAAGEPGPYIVVAHSFGGVYARLFAAQTGSDHQVVGLVMLDTYEPDLGMADDPALSEDLRAEIQRSLDGTAEGLANGESLDWQATLDDLEAAGPVTVAAITLWRDPKSRFADPDPARAIALQESWARNITRIYPTGTIEIVPNTGHFIYLDRPDVVLDRVRALVTRFRPIDQPTTSAGSADR